jgi:hypothetical protein
MWSSTQVLVKARPSVRQSAMEKRVESFLALLNAGPRLIRPKHQFHNIIVHGGLSAPRATLAKSRLLLSKTPQVRKRRRIATASDCSMVRGGIGRSRLASTELRLGNVPWLFQPRRPRRICKYEWRVLLSRSAGGLAVNSENDSGAPESRTCAILVPSILVLTAFHAVFGISSAPGTRPV